MNINSCQIDNMHSGKKHSCETQLITVIDDWAKILDKGGQVDTFILDFEKAFDTPPPHELLKCKLYGYGIGGKTLKWIDSFLSDRKQRVMVMELYQIGPLFYRVSPRAPFLDLCYSRCTLMILQKILTRN